MVEDRTIELAQQAKIYMKSKFGETRVTPKELQDYTNLVKADTSATLKAKHKKNMMELAKIVVAKMQQGQETSIEDLVEQFAD